MVARNFSLFLLPSIFQAAISFLILPFTTLVLGPSDYGAFAIGIAVAALGQSIATTAGGLILPAHFPERSNEEQSSIVCGLLLVALAVFAIYAFALLLGWSTLARNFATLSSVTVPWLAMAIGGAGLSIPWAFAYLVVILEGKGAAYAAVTVSSALAAAIATIICIFWVQLHTSALFIGYLAATTVQCTGALVILFRYRSTRDFRTWVRRALRLTLISAPANSLEVAQTGLERVLLASSTGLNVVGIYTHATQYRNTAFLPLKALSNAVWSISLSEARDSSSRFVRTKAFWRPAYALLTAVGVGFALLGDYLVSVLTNGKFVGAGPIAGYLMMVLLVQYSGKPQLAVLYANDEGEYLARLMGGAAAAAIVVLFLAVPTLGIFGVLLALLTQQLIYRVGIHYRSSRIRPIEFQDGPVLAGLTITLTASWVQAALQPGFWWSAGIWLLSTGALASLSGSLSSSDTVEAWRRVRTYLRQPKQDV